MAWAVLLYDVIRMKGKHSSPTFAAVRSSMAWRVKQWQKSGVLGGSVRLVALRVGFSAPQAPVRGPPPQIPYPMSTRCTAPSKQQEPTELTGLVGDHWMLSEQAGAPRGLLLVIDCRPPSIVRNTG
jgi:hypothetical protein